MNTLITHGQFKREPLYGRTYNGKLYMAFDISTASNEGMIKWISLDALAVMNRDIQVAKVFMNAPTWTSANHKETASCVHCGRIKYANELTTGMCEECAVTPPMLDTMLNGAIADMGRADEIVAADRDVFDVWGEYTGIEDSDPLAEHAALADGVAPGDPMLSLKDGQAVTIAPEGELSDLDEIAAFRSHSLMAHYLQDETQEELINGIHGMARELVEVDVLQKTIDKERAEHASEIDMLQGKVARLEAENKALWNSNADWMGKCDALESENRRLSIHNTSLTKELDSVVKELQSAKATQVAPVFPIDEAAFKAHMSEIINLSVNDNQ